MNLDDPRFTTLMLEYRHVIDRADALTAKYEALLIKLEAYEARERERETEKNVVKKVEQIITDHEGSKIRTLHDQKDDSKSGMFKISRRGIEGPSWLIAIIFITILVALFSLPISKILDIYRQPSSQQPSKEISP